jgi:hypothetical protein
MQGEGQCQKDDQEGGQRGVRVKPQMLTPTEREGLSANMARIFLRGGVEKEVIQSYYGKGRRRQRDDLAGSERTAHPPDC